MHAGVRYNYIGYIRHKLFIQMTDEAKQNSEADLVKYISYIVSVKSLETLLFLMFLK